MTVLTPSALKAGPASSGMQKLTAAEDLLEIIMRRLVNQRCWSGLAMSASSLSCVGFSAALCVSSRPLR